MCTTCSCSGLFSCSFGGFAEHLNALLTALVYHGVGRALQRCLSDEELGEVALTCHFECDPLCEEMSSM